MEQKWHDLLFAHWPVPVAAMRELVPRPLELDLYDGTCWVGVVPFWMSGVRARGTPGLPGISRFAELNVRTYVSFGGKAGVYFFSLDAASRAAVMAARALYHLPYYFADMKVRSEGEQILYFSARAANAEFHGQYEPVGPAALRDPGTLEYWLTERYCLYTVHHGTVWRGDIHHAPWPLQDARAEIERNTMAAAAGIELPNCKPVLHFSKHQDVLIWRLSRVERA